MSSLLSRAQHTHSDSLIWDHECRWLGGQTDDKRQKQEGTRSTSGHLGGSSLQQYPLGTHDCSLTYNPSHFKTLSYIWCYSVLYSQIKDSCLPDYVLVGVRYRLKKQKDRKIGSQKTRNTMKKMGRVWWGELGLLGDRAAPVSWGLQKLPILGEKIEIQIGINLISKSLHLKF